MTLSGIRLARDEPGARARLLRRAAYVALGALLGLAAGIALSSRAPQRYESTMQLLVGPVGAERSTLDASGLLSRTYADLLTSRNAVNRAADSLGVTVEDGDVSAIADDKSRVILLVVRSDDPTTPPRLATTLAADLIVLVEGSQQGDDALLDGGTDPGQVRVLDNATDPARELSRVPVLTVVGMLVAGAGLGLAFGAVAPRSRRRPIDRQYLELIGLKVISLEQVTSMRRRRFLSKTSTNPVANKRDEFELVFQQLLIGCVQQGRFQTVLFVPVTQEVERDTAELMMLLAHAGDRLSCTVELADIDPENPLLEDVQTSGTGIEKSSPIDLSTESGLKRIARLIDLSAEKLLFLAAPAVGTSVRALTGAPAADRIVLVARSGETERRDVRSLLDDLELLDVEPVLVLDLGRGELVSMPEHGVQAIGLLDSVDRKEVDARAAQQEESRVEDIVDFDFLEDLLAGSGTDRDDDVVEADVAEFDESEFDESQDVDVDLDEIAHLVDADSGDEFEEVDDVDQVDEEFDDLEDLFDASDEFDDLDDQDELDEEFDDLEDEFDDLEDLIAAGEDLDGQDLDDRDVDDQDLDGEELVDLDPDDDLDDDDFEVFDDLTADDLADDEEFDEIDDLDLDDVDDDDEEEYVILGGLDGLTEVSADDDHAQVEADVGEAGLGDGGEQAEAGDDDGDDPEVDVVEETGWNGATAKRLADEALSSMRSAGRWKR